MKQLKKVIILIIITITILFNTNTTVYADSTLNCRNYLYYNSTGEQVKILQQSLNKAMNCNLAVDGIFGNKTYQCVTKFQKQYNLAVDGIVGINTCSKLNSLTKKQETNNTSYAPYTDTRSYVVVSANKLNVRASATTKSKILTVVNNGKILRTYGTKKVNGTTWYKIYINEKYAYVSGDYVKKNAIVLSISKQNLKLFQDGKLTMNVPVITGKKGTYDTPTGHYKLYVSSKETSRYLRGKNEDGTNYNAYVDYWMPFNGGIGFHDADWRSINQYNTETYKTSGSHGCVNMQKQDAAKLYNTITTNTDVFVTK